MLTCTLSPAPLQLDKYFENVCELDIMFNIEKAHYILGATPGGRAAGLWVG